MKITIMNAPKAPNTTVTTNPAQPGTPAVLNKGQWKELVISNNTSFIFEADKPFLPVQYLEGENGGAGGGPGGCRAHHAAAGHLEQAAAQAAPSGSDTPSCWKRAVSPASMA